VDTRHLRSFLKVADTGSITRAAESLGIAQPSLSQQLLRLENELGFDLFRRTARGVTLTEGGRIFQEHARQILRSAEQAIEDGRRFGAEPAGEVILAVPYSISRLAGVTLVEAFRRHAPQVSFHLAEAFTGQIRGWLDAGKVDLGVMHDLGPLPHLSARRLASEELFLVGPPGRYGDAAAMPDVPVAELAGLPMILPAPAHGLRQVVEQEAARFGVSIKVAQTIDAMSHIGALVAAGHGYSVLPLPVIAEDLDAGRISIARLGGGAVRRTLCLARNRSQVVTHASVRCEDLTIKVLSRLIEKGVWAAELDPALRSAR
jgi:LysR family nitrogen assimilation transcriptional regulator